MNQFAEKLLQAQRRNQSWVCIGLDPVVGQLPQGLGENPLVPFCQALVEATADLVCAFKPNLAFWLAEGAAGLAALKTVVDGMPKDTPVLLDAKFNDIGHSAAAYAHFAFDQLGVDAVTVNPYLGLDGARPFLERAERGVFVLARTSNPSAPDLQNQPAGDHLLYEQVAQLAARWSAEFPSTCGLVAGATYPDELARLRALTPTLPFLIPGIGAQNGDLSAAVAHGPTATGIGPVVNSSRGILYASSGPDYADAARSAASDLREQINQRRKEVE
jgi:orotidine-5'-phosphate decarboxylase